MLYCFKTEVSVLPNGLAMNCTKYYAESVSEIRIFRENRRFHKRAFVKTAEELCDFQDGEHLADEFGGFWAILVKKRYQGADNFIRTITAKKKPILGTLLSDEIRRNENISSDQF